MELKKNDMTKNNMAQIDRVVLAINPGSTSTKISVFDGTVVRQEMVLRHQSSDLAKFDDIVDQLEYRTQLVLDALLGWGIEIAMLDAIVGRGGLLRPMASGTYPINAAMCADLRSGRYGHHASNLGGLMAFALAQVASLPCFVVDPVVVDEMSDVARLSGLPEYPRISIFHALNQKAVAKRVALQQGVPYESMNLIVCHMGGGISIGAHHRGKVIDVNNALMGDGPYSPERAGGLPNVALIDLCYHNSEAQVKKKLVGQGGLVAYLGSNDGREVQAMIAKKDEYAKLVYQGMAYQIAKEIGAAAAVLAGDIDAIILTGGLAYDAVLVGWIEERVSFLGEVIVVPGEDEMLALCEGALRVMDGKEIGQIYG